MEALLQHLDGVKKLFEQSASLPAAALQALSKTQKTAVLHLLNETPFTVANVGEIAFKVVQCGFESGGATEILETIQANRSTIMSEQSS